MLLVGSGVAITSLINWRSYAILSIVAAASLWSNCSTKEWIHLLTNRKEHTELKMEPTELN